MQNLKLLALAALAATSLVHRAAEAACSTTPVSYYKPIVFSTSDTRATFNFATQRWSLDLKGYMHLPTTPGPYPLIIDNHGSESDPSTGCNVATYFNSRGYAVFVPHRRGHGDSTGVTLADYVASRCTLASSASDRSERCKMEYLHLQEADVEAAINFAKTVKDGNGALVVDPNRIFLMGHSYGGLVSLFANTKTMGQRAIVTVAGGSQSWDTGGITCPTNGTAGTAECELLKAHTNATKPIYAFEPANDVSIEPTIQGAKQSALAGKDYQSAIFPVVCNGTCDPPGALPGDDWTFAWRNSVHGSYMGKTSIYGPSVVDFFERYSPATTPVTPPTVTPTIVSYDKPQFININSDDTRCDFDLLGHCTKIDLKGYLYTPNTTSGTHPLVVYHHGNSDSPSSQSAIASWFVSKGYVVFVPHRRGAGLSTGVAISWHQQNDDDFVPYLNDHALDVASSVQFARNVKRADGSAWVDQARVSVIGHSMGAQVSLIANGNDMNVRGIVAISPSPASWGIPEIQAAMFSAVEGSLRPIFILQPLDDITIEPTIGLAEAAGHTYLVNQSALYPAVGGPSPHDTFPTQKIATWGPTAIEFMTRN